jgi:hypothetical protein
VSISPSKVVLQKRKEDLVENGASPSKAVSTTPINDEKKANALDHLKKMREDIL